MIGCDKFCTYCIVPSVRGPEQSRPPAALVAEAKQLADEGCLEITLVGQTVNSYKYREGDRTVRLSDLLERLHAIDGIRRIKFVTNYPKDMSDDLLSAVRDLPKCSKYLHVPVQSGSNKFEADVPRLHRRRISRDAAHVRLDSGRRERFHRRLRGETGTIPTVELVRESRFKAPPSSMRERPGTKGRLVSDDSPK